VSGASGVAQAVQTTRYYPNVFVYLCSGGVPPYSNSPGMQLDSNPSGKLFLANFGDGLHITIGWSNFAINEVQSAKIVITTRDSAGASVKASATVTVQRVS
jgi:hypothetical protein